MSLFKCEICLDALIMSLARMYAMPINFYLGLLEGEAYHMSRGCINIYLRNLICSTHFLACKTFSHLMAWWIYRQVDLRCLHSQCKCPLFCWWSLMKWWQTSICFVLECWTGLLVNLIALSLSHSNGTFLNLIPKSFKVAFIQRICAQQLLADMYSASAVDNATLFCFFDDHKTSDLPNNWHVPKVLFLLTLHPA